METLWQQKHYMKNGCFWCLLDDVNGVVELKRRFVLPEYQGNSYGKRDTTFRREKKFIL